MAKRGWSRRRRAEEAPQQPRNRVAEIQAEIGTSNSRSKHNAEMRRDPHARGSQGQGVFNRGTNQQAGCLPLAEAMQASIEDRRTSRSLTQGAGRTIKEQGRRDVTLRTTCGQVEIRLTYFSRNCDRDKAGKGMYPLLVLWGVHDRCTAGIVAEISKLVAILGSLEEVEQVLFDRGQPLDIKTIRAMAYRFATAPCRPACREFELGRDCRGSSRGPLHRWRPDSDSHKQVQYEDRQGTQPLSHGLAQAEAADHLRGG